MEQRDAAFLAGARGATTLILKGGKLVMPSSDLDMGKEYPSMFEKISYSLKPKEGDAVVIGSADTLRTAEYGAIAAVWTIADNDDY